MYTKERAANEAVQALKRAVQKGAEIQLGDLESPPDYKMGDLAFPCFALAKQMRRAPNEIATELAAKIGPTDLIKSVHAVGPYVNFRFNDEVFAHSVLSEVHDSKGTYGAHKTGEGKKIVVEYAQPNTHKEFHVGHIRNAVYGQSIVNVLRSAGYDVVAASYIGDIGAHVAKALWGLTTLHPDEEIPKEMRAKRLGEIYSEATAYLEEHPEEKERVHEVQRLLEAGEDPWNTDWETTRKWSLDAFKRIFKELHVQPDVWYFESEVEQPGKQLVKKMLTDGIAKKSEGAIVVDLEDADLRTFLILKSDGSSLYATKDLALALKKDEDHAADRQIIITDNRQAFYFQQLFEALRRMGFEKQLINLTYDMVNLPEGTMSSRSGNIVTYDSLRAEMESVLRTETAGRHEDWSQTQIDTTAQAIAGASISFMMLRQDPESIITFDMKEAMSFDGFTAPYILYTYARIESLKKKAFVKPLWQEGALKHDLEMQIVRSLADFPGELQDVAQSYRISRLAIWAFELAKLVNEYYHEVRILDDEDESRIQARLYLLAAAQIGLKRAMQLLTIDVIEQM